MNLQNLASLLSCGLALTMTSSFFAQDAGGDVRPSPAAATGTITGLVVDHATGDPLANARVAIAGTTVATGTERGGSFTLRSVPAGDHTLVVMYTGFDTTTRAVHVDAGRDTTVRVELSSGLVEMDAYVVNFQRGEADEIMLRRQATNIVDVVSSKTFGEMADGSLTITRLVGMTGGTGIRGIAGEFNLVRVDGAPIATPSDSTASGTTRSVDINQIPGDMIERIEVTKSLRPDVDADAVGGIINLVTKSTLDRPRRRTTYSVGGIASPSYEVQKMGYLASFEHSDLLGSSRRLGYSLSLNHNRRWSNVEQIITEYFTDLVRGINRGGPAPTSSFRAAQELKYEDRTGVGLKFDYKPVNTLITQFGAQYQRRYSRADSADWRLTNRTNLLVYDSAGGFWYAPTQVRAGRGNADGEVPIRDANGNIISGAAGRGQGGVLNTFTPYISDFLSVRQLRYLNRLQDQYRDTYSCQFSAQYSGLPDTRIEFGVSYSWGNAKRREWPDGLGNYQFDVTGSIVRIDRTEDYLHPKVIFLGGTSPDNVDAVGTVNLLQLLDATQIEEQTALTLNMERALRTRVPIVLKSGLRYRGVVRDIDRGEHQYSHLGKNRDFIGSTSINPFGLYPSSNVPDIRRVRESLKTQPNLWKEDMLTYIQKQHEHNGHAAEQIQAAYLMAEARLGRFTLLPGVRAEWTRAKGSATVQNEGLDETPYEWLGRATNWGKYKSVFPHFHAKYDVRENLVVRAAWSTGIGRPPWKNILPEGSITPESQTITMNNTNLRPQYTTNYDLGAEYYFQSGGILGVNLFRKDIKDLIFQTSRFIGPGEGFDPAYEGWKLITGGNAAWAWVEGVEFDFRQQLKGLSRWLERFSVFANLTLLDTAGNYSTPDGSVTSNIPGFVPKVANAGVSYTGRDLSLRVHAQYRDEHLSNWDERTTEYWRYNEAGTTVDVLSSYRLTRRLNLFLNISNLFEDSPVQFQARPSQPYNVSKTSRRFDFGIRGSL